MFGVNIRRKNGEYWAARQYADLTRHVLERLNQGGRFVIRPNYPLTWNVEAWTRRISGVATVEHTPATITVRPK
jgi:hypothetical protein